MTSTSIHPKFWRVVCHGLTLVETLVVIAIIAILVALTLPALQAVREAARRVQCQNQLRQLGIAIQHYELSNSSLPPGCHEWRPWGGSSDLKNFAWSAMILPFLEQSQLHNLVDFRLPYDHPLNAQAAGTTISVFLCPSNSNSRSVGGGRSDYGGIYGQRLTVSNPTDNGVFIYNRAIRFAEILDGLTHTISVAEDCDSPDAEWINGSNVLEQGGLINDATAWIWDNEIRSKHPGGALGLFVCGRVEFLGNETAKSVLASLITRDFGD